MVYMLASTYAAARDKWAPMSTADRTKLLTELGSDPDHAEEGDHDWKTWPPESLAPHDWAALPPQIHALIMEHLPVEAPPPPSRAAQQTEARTETSKKK
jgi:hypothetical protein